MAEVISISAGLIAWNVAHEALVDLQLADREALEIGRIAGAEIVDDTRAELAQGGKAHLGADALVDKGALREFQFEIVRRQSGIFENITHDLVDVRQMEIAAATD